MSLQHRTLPNLRLIKLKEALEKKKKLRFIEAHNGLSGLIACSSKIQNPDGSFNEFDGLWISSLTDSAAKGYPDTGVVDPSSRLATIQEIISVTDKPIIVDGDTGGEDSSFEYFCSKLENIGVSATIIEDKQFPKRNSLDADNLQILEDPHRFATKINRGKSACLSPYFMIFARIESFIAGYDLQDALIRAEIYLQSQADGIFIHSQKNTPEEIFAFTKEYQVLCNRLDIYKPLICVPTSYSQITEEELFANHLDIVIYANHLLRAADKSMRQVCESILTHHRSFEATPNLSSVKAIFEITGALDIKEKDSKFFEKSPGVILLSAGQPTGFALTEYEHLSICDIPVHDKKILDYQIDTLHAQTLSDISVVVGYGAEAIETDRVKLIYNPNYKTTKSMYSLFLARDKLQDNCIIIFGDILFDEKIIEHLLSVPNDIVIVTDNSINMKLRKDFKPSTDLVISTEYSSEASLRKLNKPTEKIIDIGDRINPESATHEFVGIAKFTKVGIDSLCSVYQSLVESTSRRKDGEEELHGLDFSDLLHEMITRGCDVQSISIHRGWAEIHNLNDVKTIGKFFDESK
jgi:phosphoenolpyruvate mutase